MDSSLSVDSPNPNMKRHRERKEDGRDRDREDGRREEREGRRRDDSRDGVKLTKEERLLADLLAANEALVEVLKVYDDLERVAIERKTEDRSRREVRMDRRVSYLLSQKQEVFNWKCATSVLGCRRDACV